MSTRCNIHFIRFGQVQSNVYRHSDGYPQGPIGVRAALRSFFAEVKRQTTDTRFQDASMLAVRFVIWHNEAINAFEQNLKQGKWVKEKIHPLAATGLRIMVQDAGDIAWVYEVNCDTLVRGVPKITAYRPGKEKCRLGVRPPTEVQALATEMYSLPPVKALR